MKRIAYILIACATLGCTNPRTEPSDSRTELSETELSEGPLLSDSIAVGSNDDEMIWRGIYVSTSEIMGYSGTVLSLGAVKDGKRACRKYFYSDVVNKPPELPPIIETSGDQLLVTEIRTQTKYTRLEINGHVVLMREDALKQYKENNKLYDYGILIKISDDPTSAQDLTRVKHPSIRILYENKNADWNDPFLHGPNPR